MTDLVLNTAVLMAIGLVTGTGAGIALMALLRSLRAGWRPGWLMLPGEVPWTTPKDVRALGREHGTTDLVWVGRHEIAECGLACPICKTEAAACGDFSGVRRCRINGKDNEVIRCKGTVTGSDGLSRPCGAWLAASPDTEHGDHLDPDPEKRAKGVIRTDDPDEHRRFVRRTPEQVLADRYGVEVRQTEAGGTEGPGLAVDLADKPKGETFSVRPIAPVAPVEQPAPVKPKRRGWMKKSLRLDRLTGVRGVTVGEFTHMVGYDCPKSIYELIAAGMPAKNNRKGRIIIVPKDAKVWLEDRIKTLAAK